MKICISLTLILSLSLLFAKAQSNSIGPGIAMSFNGTSGSYVDLGDVYNGVNFPITFEAWVYPTSTPNYNPIFASDNSTGNYSGFTVRLDNGYIFFSMGDGTGVGAANRIGVYSSSSIPINRWTHIACVAVMSTSCFAVSKTSSSLSTTQGPAIKKKLLLSPYCD
jgi:hypothetical protein